MTAASSFLISASELAELLNSDHPPVLLDCRFDLATPEAGQAEYNEGHLPGAFYAHLDRDLSGPIQAGVTGRHTLPDPASLQARLRAWGLSADTPLVVYDASNGPYSARAWWLARWAGLTNVRVLDGGLKAWLERNGKLVSDIPAPPASSDLIVQCPPDWVIDADTLQQQLTELTLIDARAAIRYSGETEPLDPIAGHIPGAYCVDFTANLDAQGRFHDAATLQQRFEPLPDSGDWVCYCGSGVSACHNILAMAVAGLPQPKLYSGSWSHWITDSHRPIETGLTKGPL
ncbi:sulfurtransferase [Saccharospirillum mangrovi]|uniref:sulfurtransferase n=1 Tax=Saccharospirillum mangrovi TaxID=2161747 RepID=UPI000D34BE00|nr:sulfurtransferase [Saccharospirillum mangrovi]